MAAAPSPDNPSRRPARRARRRGRLQLRLDPRAGSDYYSRSLFQRAAL